MPDSTSQAMVLRRRARSVALMRSSPCAAEQHDLVVGPMPGHVGDIDGQRVHGDDADDRHAPAPNERLGTRRCGARVAVAVAEGQGGDARRPLRPPRCARSPTLVPAGTSSTRTARALRLITGRSAARRPRPSGLSGRSGGTTPYSIRPGRTIDRVGAVPARIPPEDARCVIGAASPAVEDGLPAPSSRRACAAETAASAGSARCDQSPLTRDTGLGCQRADEGERPPDRDAITRHARLDLQLQAQLEAVDADAAAPAACQAASVSAAPSSDVMASSMPAAAASSTALPGTG